MAKVRNRKRQPRAAAETGSTPTISIGERLRLARESRGLDVPAVAEQLHLKQSMVLALEGEDFSRLPARVFVRGYYRNYARLLALPEEQLLREFDARCPEGEECTGAPPVVAQSVKQEIRSSHGLVKLVTWLVVISLFAAFGWWWKDYSDKQTAATGEDAPSAPAMLASDDKGGGAVDVAVVREETAPDQQGEAGSTKPGEPEQERGGGASVASSMEKPAPEKPSRSVAESKQVLPVSRPKQIELRFSEDSWVDIRGANRSFKLVGTRKAGELVELEGTPPYNIILGNARGVTILVNGKPHDFSSKTRRNVARLTLDP